MRSTCAAVAWLGVMVCAAPAWSIQNPSDAPRQERAQVGQAQTPPGDYVATARFERSMGLAGQMLDNAALLKEQPGVLRKLTERDITSHDALNKLIVDLKLDKDLPRAVDGKLTTDGVAERERMIRELREHIRIKFEIEGRTVDQVAVSVYGSDAQLIEHEANYLVQNYIAATRKAMDRQLLSAKEFFAREYSKVSAKLSELETKLMQFKLDHPGFNPDDPYTLRRTLNAAREKRAQLEKQFESLQARADQLRQWMEDQPEFVEVPRDTTSAQRKLETAYHHAKDIMEKALAGAEADVSPEAIARVRDRLAAVERELASLQDSPRSERRPNEGRLGVEAQTYTLEKQIEQVKQSLEDLNMYIEELANRDRNFFRLRAEFLGFQREVDSAREQAALFADKLKETQIALQTEISQRGVRMGQIERASAQPVVEPVDY